MELDICATFIALELESAMVQGMSAMPCLFGS